MTPVSYTHLDVYKRQVLVTGRLLLWMTSNVHLLRTGTDRLSGTGKRLVSATDNDHRPGMRTDLQSGRASLLLPETRSVLRSGPGRYLRLARRIGLLLEKDGGLLCTNGKSHHWRTGTDRLSGTGNDLRPGIRTGLQSRRARVLPSETRSVLRSEPGRYLRSARGIGLLLEKDGERLCRNGKVLSLIHI